MFQNVLLVNYSNAIISSVLLYLETMTLLGSIRRPQLQMLLTRYLSNNRRDGSRRESEASISRSGSPVPLLPERR